METKTSPQQQFLLYIHKINEDSPQAILPSLAQLSSIFINENLTTQSLNLLKTWVKTLQGLCADLSEVDKISLLSDYFFNELSFKLITKKQSQAQEKDLLLSSMILQKRASFLPLAFLYHYLAQQINLPLFFITNPQLSLLKYYGKNSCLFVNFQKLGRLNSTEDYLNTSSLKMQDLEVVSFKDTYIHYLENLLQYYNKELKTKNTDELKLALQILEQQKEPLSNYDSVNLNESTPPPTEQNTTVYTLH